jgi:hypothetical protein
LEVIMSQVFMQQAVAGGADEALVTEALKFGFDWQTLLTFITEYGPKGVAIIKAVNEILKQPAVQQLTTGPQPALAPATLMTVLTMAVKYGPQIAALLPQLLALWPQLVALIKAIQEAAGPTVPTSPTL